MLTTLAAAALAAGLLAGPAAAQEPCGEPGYPPCAGVIQISDSSIDCPSGEDLTITGEGFVPGTGIDILFDGEQVASTTADDQGEFSVTIDPPGAAAGQHTITADPEEGESATATLTCVVGAAVAVTGSNISLGLILLVALVVVGGVALVAGRRRARRVA
jgi:hypothetical protein